MPNVYPAKVNRTVHHKVEIGGVVRWRPAVITARIDDDTADLRVGHHGETYTSVDRRSGADMPGQAVDGPNPGEARSDLDKWRPG